MSSKYDKLTDHLRSLEPGEWWASFADVERILGSSLPTSARKYPAWWANQAKAQSLSWMRAGWKTMCVDVEKEELMFVHDDQVLFGIEALLERHGKMLPVFEKHILPLTITEAKERLAETFGVEPSQVEIIIRSQ